eukprot:2856723-Pyramimonas_sp.AAC.1
MEKAETTMDNTNKINLYGAGGLAEIGVVSNAKKMVGGDNSLQMNWYDSVGIRTTLLGFADATSVQQARETFKE